MLGKKRGTIGILYRSIISLILVLFVLGSMMYFISEIEDRSLFEKLYLSRDMALLANTIQSTPGDAVVSYTQPDIDLSKHNYDFERENRIIISNEESTIEVGYPIFYNNFLSKNLFVAKHPFQVIFFERHNVLQLGANFMPDIQSKIDLTCTDTKSTITEKETASVLAPDKIKQGLEQKLKSELDFKTITSPTENTNLILSISATSDELESQSARIYYKSEDEQSEKLACLIIKDIQDSIEDIEISKPLALDEKIPYNNKGLKIHLELFNINEENIKEMPSIIIQGVEKYYE